MSGMAYTKTISSTPTGHSGRSRWVLRRALLLGLAAVLCAPAAGLAQASPTARDLAKVPLDTLANTPPLAEEQDPRYQGADLNISRKLLPDVAATTVPKAKTPRTPPRLDNPSAGAWNFHKARRAAVAGDPHLAHESLKAALKAAPYEPRYQWWQSAQALKKFDTATLVQVLPRSLRALVDSPVTRGRLIVALHQCSLLLVGLFWTVLVVGLYLCFWRIIAHDLGALLLKNRRHTLHLWLPILLPMGFILLKPGWFGFLAAFSVPLLIRARGRVRALLAITWIAAVTLVFPAWPPLRSAVPTVDPTSEVTLLDRACQLPPSGALSDDLRRRLQSATDSARRDRLMVALAIQEARRGSYSRSNELFNKVLKTDPTNFPAQVGLANNTYYQGRLDDAAGQYRATAAAHPRRGEVPYNMAQVYFKKLFVPEATEALEEARSLGFTPPTWADPRGRRDGYSPVVYPTLTARSMEAACAFEADRYPALVTIASWQPLLGAQPVPLFWLICVPLLLAALVVLWWSNQHDPRGCENCGLPVCRTCCRVRDGAWLCPTCGETADRARSDMILATLLKNRSRAEGMAHTHRIVRVGRLLPGVGHLASERLAAAWFRFALVAVGLFLIAAGWTFDPGAQWSSPGLLLEAETINPQWLPLPAAAWPGWTGLPILIGAALLALAWLIALFDGPGLRRGIPDRYSLVPAPESASTPVIPAVHTSGGPGMGTGGGLR